MSFTVGQHVACVDDTFDPPIAALYTTLPVKGKVYVIRDLLIGQEPYQRNGQSVGTGRVLLVGLRNPDAVGRPGVERGFKPERFRPLDELPSIEKPQPQTEEAVYTWTDSPLKV